MKNEDAYFVIWLSNFASTLIKVLHYSSTEKHHPERLLSDKLVSYLKGESCKDINSLKKVHAHIITSGLKNHVFLSSKLLVCYAKFDNLTESKRVFNTIANKSQSLWNSTLVGYFRTGHHNEVLKLYCDFKKHSSIDSSSITFGLKTCIVIGSLQFGRGIHVDAVKYNLQRNGFVGSTLIGFYSKYGCITDARQVFDEISERDVVVYTAMVTGYAAQVSDSYYGYEAFEVARLMQKEDGLDPNKVTLVSLLQAAANVEAYKEGRAVHGMNKRCVGSWNVLIAAHVQMGQLLEAFELFQTMSKEDILPDRITLANLLSSCGDMKFLRQGKSIHAYIIRREVQLDLVATTALIEMYSKCNRTNQGRILFDEIEAQDVIMFNVMVSGYLQAGFTDKALETICGMIKAGIKPDTATILNLLSLSADLREIRIGKEVHAYIVRRGMGSNVDIANQLLSMYAKFGLIEIARKIFNRITRRDLISWTWMITSYAQNAYASDALMLFRLMQEEKLQPDLVTLVSLLQAVSRLGCLLLAKEVHGHIYRNLLDKELLIINSLLTTYAKCGGIDFAEYLFKSIVKKSQISWNTMISAFGMHGKCLEALDLFNQMLKEEAYGLVQHLPPRERTSALDALLSSCRIYGNVEVGDIVGRELLDLDPNNSATYVLLANLYAEAGEWGAAARIREIAKAKSLVRQPGYSYLQRLEILGSNRKSLTSLRRNMPPSEWGVAGKLPAAKINYGEAMVVADTMPSLCRLELAYG
ncbi:hypothetical protein C5167_034948 [Papaver somniferum]|uniref:Pentacotripeptide-repeat region of PRORP domain-containing protein n=1 Tax=Papaver somniferum TaxID=3469 RepID=A0A4Y7KHD2_PAPSO|nr:hypothetical protein C5167_034948 [Papaver somniferum]